MNEPRYQFWRPIQPVEGQPIPEGAMYRVAQAGCKTWCPSMTGDTFRDVDRVLEWRVPVEVVPLDLAVDAIMHNAIEVNGDSCWIVEIDGQREYRADTKKQLRELVIAKLRELLQEASCSGRLTNSKNWSDKTQ